jgi:hypothetical protein
MDQWVLLLPQTVTVGDALIWINPNDPVISGALTFRVYEPGEIAFFRAHIGGCMTRRDPCVNHCQGSGHVNGSPS